MITDISIASEAVEQFKSKYFHQSDSEQSWGFICGSIWNMMNYIINQEDTCKNIYIVKPLLGFTVWS